MESRRFENMTKDELITELEELRAMVRRYRTLLDDSSDSIFSLDRQGNYLYANEQFAKGIGQNRVKDVIGSSIWEMFPEGEAGKRFSIVKSTFETKETRTVEVRLPRLDGDIYHLTTLKPIFDDQGDVAFVLCVSKDITERKAMEEKLKRNAHFDGLTELPNRLLFSEYLRYAIVQAERDNKNLALMYVDLDHFKPVNDTHGHDAGDLLLREVAGRMQHCIRKSDSVGRIGGDEFLILLPTLDSQKDALDVAEKIRVSIDQPFELSGYPVITISASVGVAIYPEHGTNELQLSKKADQAMYAAKMAGRNQVKVFMA